MQLAMKNPNKPMLLSPSDGKVLRVLSTVLFFFLGFVFGMLSNANFRSVQLPFLSSSFPLSPLLLLPPSAPSSATLLSPPPPENAEHIGLRDFLSPSGLMHDMTDEELIWRASMVPKVGSTPYHRVPKVAFLFLVRGNLPLLPLWEKFFAGHEGLYSIYMHTDPAYSGSPPKESVFYGRRIPSQKTSWGGANLVEAERRLLANALLDFSNERFVLLSESCIPIFDFPTIYAYLTNSTNSFVDCFDDQNGRWRYNPFFSTHNITLAQWRKGSQWFEMDRSLALEVVSDKMYFPVFQNFCSVRRSCFVDEHYIPTLVNLLSWEANANRTLTYMEWRPGEAHPNNHGSKEVSEDLFKKMREGATNCSYNGGFSNICFVFARKFSPDALDRLLDLAPKVMGFG